MKQRQMSYGVIGCGNLGGILVRSLAHSVVQSPTQVFAFDHSLEKTEKLKVDCGVCVAADITQLMQLVQVVLIAVKPKDVESVCAEIKKNRKTEQSLLFCSVAAGVTVSSLVRWLGPGEEVTRAMPNLPTVVGKGMTGLYSASRKNSEFFEEIFSVIGKTLIVGNEEALDIVTGLSASGVAFVMLMLEAMIAAGVELGLSRDEAELLTLQTAFGSSSMVLELKKDPAQVRQEVSSPRGTTVAGLAVLEKEQFHATLVAAVKASVARAKEISLGKS